MNANSTPLHAWVSDLSRAQNANFCFDNEQRCFIQANESSNICLHAPVGNDRFYINIDLLPISEERSETLFRRALSLNLFQHDTHGASIAFDETCSTLVLCYSGRYDMSSYQSFVNILNNMIALSTSLAQQLSQALATPTTAHSGEMPTFGILC